MRSVTIISVVILSLAACASAEAQYVDHRVVATDQTRDGEVVLRQIAGGFEHPWAIAPLPDGGVLVTERPGRLWYLATGDTPARSGGSRPASPIAVAGVPDV